MKQTLKATIVNGALQLDGPLDMPDRSRVEVTIEDRADVTTEAEPTPPGERQKAFERFRKLTEEQPLHLGGNRFTREQLHERD